MKTSARYEIDPHNRLVIRETGRASHLARFRRVIDGRFRIGKDNSLEYHVKSPALSGAGIPHQLKLRGDWSLTKDHNLKLTLDKWGRRTFGDSLTLQGELVSVRKNALLFAVSTKSKDNTRSIYTLNLEGAWQADKNNRLTFKARKESGGYDILTFSGAWEIGKDYGIIYRYEKRDLKRKSSRVHALAFQGKWDIKDKARISYLLEGDTGSAFDFNTTLGIFSGKEIKYEIGVGGSSAAKKNRRVLRLFGSWKIKQGLGLVFEARYGARKVQELIFGAEAKLSGADTITLRLRSAKEARDLGAELELSRRILKGDGLAFLRLLKDRKEAAILAGAAFRW